MKGLRMIMIIMAGAMIFSCAYKSSPVVSQKDYWTNLCNVLHTNPNKAITRDEFLAGARDISKAEQVFDQCAKNGVIGKEEAEQNKDLLQQSIKQGIMKREAVRLTGPQ
jgi:hypothetical protein